MSLKNYAIALADANRELLEAKRELEKFEEGVRKFGYPSLMSQSNAQKMNLEFEHLIAQDQANWHRWDDLKQKLLDAEANRFEAQLKYECAQNGDLE